MRLGALVLLVEGNEFFCEVDGTFGCSRPVLVGSGLASFDGRSVTSCYFWFNIPDYELQSPNYRSYAINLHFSGHSSNLRPHFYDVVLQRSPQIVGDQHCASSSSRHEARSAVSLFQQLVQVFEQLIKVQVDALRTLGFSAQRQQALRSAVNFCEDGDLIAQELLSELLFSKPVNIESRSSVVRANSTNSFSAFFSFAFRSLFSSFSISTSIFSCCASVTAFLLASSVRILGSTIARAFSHSTKVRSWNGLFRVVMSLLCCLDALVSGVAEFVICECDI